MKLSRRVFLVVFCLALMAGSTIVSAGICERAVFACMGDPMNGSPWGTVYCIEGYAFCKLYIEPYLNPQG